MTEFSDELLDGVLFSSELSLNSRTSSSSQVSSCQAHAELLNKLSDDLLEFLLVKISVEPLDELLSQVGSCRARAELLNEISDKVLDERLFSTRALVGRSDKLPLVR